MVAPHSGYWVIEATHDQEVYSPYFVVEQNEYQSQDSQLCCGKTHTHIQKVSLLAVVIFSCVINIGPVVYRFVVEYGSDIGSLTDMCLAASHRRAAAPVLATLAGRNTNTVQRLNRKTTSSLCYYYEFMFNRGWYNGCNREYYK